LPYVEPGQLMRASSPKPGMASMRNIAMFSTDITAWKINSLSCQKFTSSIPGCWERNTNQSLSVMLVKLFNYYFAERLSS
jgi:hypothetical protein